MKPQNRQTDSHFAMLVCHYSIIDASYLGFSFIVITSAQAQLFSR